tara:strand:+ start:815 stop:1528 length:714 start_codon:yes stop_codon:yes gene_type:complete
LFKIIKSKHYNLVTLNNPPANTFNSILLTDLFYQINDLNIEKPLLFTGKGNIFSAGIDLFIANKLSKKDFKDLIISFESFLMQVINHKGPTYTILNGPAIAGGFILSITTDYCYSNNVNYKVGLNQNITRLSLPSVPQSLLKTKYENDYQKFWEIKQIIEFDFNNRIYQFAKNPLKEIIKKIENFDNSFYEQKEKKQIKILNHIKINGKNYNNEFFRQWWLDETVKLREKEVKNLKT